MFLNAVILILQEILEAVLLLSMLLVLTGHLDGLLGDKGLVNRRWTLPALGLGISGAVLYGWMMPTVSVWFDYVGLEVVNAGLQFCIIACLLLACFLPLRRIAAPAIVLMACMAVVVALSIVREGSEIMLYMQGILGEPENVWPVLLGAMMALGIGLGSGVLFHYTLDSMQPRWSFRAALLLLALFAGNMAAQAVLLLTQADWLPQTAELWDSSTLITEYSVVGQLLYALVGYEANPSLAQAVVYAVSMLLILASPLFRTAWRRPRNLMGTSA